MVRTSVYYMHRQLEVVPQDTLVVTVATRMRTRSIGSVLIESFDRPHNDCRIAGIVTETDLVTKVLAAGRVPSRTSMADIISSPLITIAPDRPIGRCQPPHARQERAAPCRDRRGRTCSASSPSVIWCDISWMPTAGRYKH
ncbi:MAG: CBS domain-containing protein [Nitrospira sp.]